MRSAGKSCFNKSLKKWIYILITGRLFLGMNYRCLCLPAFFLLIIHSLSAQQSVTGRIYSSATDSVIIAATVYNKSARDAVVSGRDGRYTINAKEGDSLIFSAAGFFPDTVLVQFHMLLTEQDITLEMKMLTLGMVRLLSSYKLDSLNRRKDYAKIFDSRRDITGGNRPTSGFGVSVSPLSYFSREAKQKKQLRKRLLKQEQDDYIDQSFPAGWVATLTSLSGDSLNLFMYRYRPSYDYCRKADRTMMTVYVSDKLKEFRKPD
jgi:hypothetical protein